MLHLQQAAGLIAQEAGPILKKSSVYETAAWGFTEQDPFLNQVLYLRWAYEPEALLHKILTIELELGRKRVQKMGPRVIDIDILFFGQQTVNTPDLIVPHPRMADRRFVLTPLHELAPELMHPVFKKTIRELLQECPDPLSVHLYVEP
jgi:2-amino-4-hydroxy-6-hydroxymethyldihydropteridine diphosphokinase